MPSKLDAETANAFMMHYQEIRSGYEHCTKRCCALFDYCNALMEGHLISTRDMEDFSRVMGPLLELQIDSDTNQSGPWRQMFEAFERKRERVAAIIGPPGSEVSKTTRHEVVVKFFSLASELKTDMESLFRREIYLGRDLADLSNELGGTPKLREALAAHCPLMKWADVQLYMKTALDSPLAAKWDEQN